MTAEAAYCINCDWSGVIEEEPSICPCCGEEIWMSKYP